METSYVAFEQNDDPNTRPVVVKTKPRRVMFNFISRLLNGPPVKPWEEQALTPLNMKFRWHVGKGKIQYEGEITDAVLELTINNAHGTQLMKLHGGWKLHGAGTAMIYYFPLDATITDADGVEVTAFCKSGGHNKWSWTLGPYTSSSLVQDVVSPPEFGTWTAWDKDAGPLTSEFAEVYTKKASGRARTWRVKPPRGEKAMAEAAAKKDLVGVALSNCKLVKEETVGYKCARVGTIYVRDDMLNLPKKDLAMLLAILTDKFWAYARQNMQEPLIPGTSSALNF